MHNFVVIVLTSLSATEAICTRPKVVVIFLSMATATDNPVLSYTVSDFDSQYAYVPWLPFILPWSSQSILGSPIVVE